MDWKFWMDWLQNPQNGFTHEQARKFCEQGEKRELEESGLDFWTKVTRMSIEKRAEILKTTPEEIKKKKW